MESQYKPCRKYFVSFSKEKDFQIVLPKGAKTCNVKNGLYNEQKTFTPEAGLKVLETLAGLKTFLTTLQCRPISSCDIHVIYFK